MAQFKDLQAPVTNPAANKRLQDTQALRARAVAGQAPLSTPIGAAAQATGAALTQQAGQQALQNQAQAAGIAKGQAGLALEGQRQAAQSKIFGQQQDITKSGLQLDQQLFDVNQAAANQEQQMRLNFNDRVAQQGYLQDIEIMDWAMKNSQNEQDFRDKMQTLEQAHAKKAALVNHAYKVTMRELEREAETASQARKQELGRELAQIQSAWEEERARQANEAKNRQAMAGAASTILGAGIAAAAVTTGVVAAPLAAPIAMAAGAGLQGSGLTKNLLGGFK